MLSRSLWLALGLTLALIGWLLSGYPYQGPTELATPAGETTEPMAVQVLHLRAEPTERRLVLPGQLQPNRTVTLRARTSGVVEQILAERGARVVAGSTLLRLDMEDRQARLAQAEAVLAQRQEDYDALLAMGNRGFQSDTQVRQALADLEAARAELLAIQLEIDYTTVKAPFAGVVHDRGVELGTLVERGDTLLTLVDNDPLVLSSQVPQQRIAKLQPAARGQVRLADERWLEGRLRYIAPRADEQTRTFEVELEIPNPDGRQPSGISGELHLPLETVLGHFLSPAQLALDAAGVLGVKVVDDGDRVAFLPVEILHSTPEGVWVTGLPEQIRVISVGQGFVQAGETVRPVSATQSTLPEGNPQLAHSPEADAS